MVGRQRCGRGGEGRIKNPFCRWIATHADRARRLRNVATMASSIISFRVLIRLLALEAININKSILLSIMVHGGIIGSAEEAKLGSFDVHRLAK